MAAVTAEGVGICAYLGVVLHVFGTLDLVCRELHAPALMGSLVAAMPHWLDACPRGGAHCGVV